MEKNCAIFFENGIFESGVIPADFIEKHQNRRHLSESQWAIVAAKIANLMDGQPLRSGATIGGIRINEAAQLLSVGERSVQRAKKIAAGRLASGLGVPCHGALAQWPKPTTNRAVGQINKGFAQAARI